MLSKVTVQTLNKQSNYKRIVITTTNAPKISKTKIAQASKQKNYQKWTKLFDNLFYIKNRRKKILTCLVQTYYST